MRLDFLRKSPNSLNFLFSFFSFLFILQAEPDAAKKNKKDPEDEEVDIMAVDKIADMSSDEEDELFYLPTVPEPDSR